MVETKVGSLSMFGSNSFKEKKTHLHYRIVLLGAAKVGKTSIIRRFLSDKFEEKYKPTVEELYEAQYKLSGSVALTLDILDTSGSYSFPAMRKLAILSGDAFILVYSVDDCHSFEEMCHLRDLIIQERAQNIPPIIVVSNKTDLKEQRAIKHELAETLVTIDWEIRFVECSAKLNENIHFVFRELLKQKTQPHCLSTKINFPINRKQSPLPYCSNKWLIKKKTKHSLKNKCIIF